MPPKRTRKIVNVPEGMTPQNFEEELKNLAAKAREESWTKTAGEQFVIYSKTAFLLALAAISSNVSQLALSPVFGSFPSAARHSQLVMVACFVGWAGSIRISRALPMKPVLLLPLIALYIPAVQFFAYKLSDTLTAEWGPLVVEALTLFPLLTLTVACVASYLEGADLSFLPRVVADSAPGLGAYVFFKSIETISANRIGSIVGQSFFLTRVGLEIALAGAFAVFAPSMLVLFGLPALLHTAFFNTHIMTPMATAALNTTLQSNGWLLLDRKESLTGYISVIQSLEQNFRVLRCDHSLLGGDWVKFRGRRVPEPIYSVFVMLEAVRLVETEKPIIDEEAKALVIGLGIGTTPGALINHGIDTTIVEIDPVVHEFATKYFELPVNHKSVISDAVGYTADLALREPESFDYIVHDVFTGGAEPIALFTLEFLEGLRELLKPDGVIALNYAGDFLLPIPRKVLQTIHHVFPTCRIYREVPPPTEAEIAEQGQDFANMVIFCRKTRGSKSDAGIKFRKATEADKLGSITRETYLQPEHEVTVAEARAYGILANSDEADSNVELGLVRANETEALTKAQTKSALGHWRVMRIVVPAWVWENW